MAIDISAINNVGEFYSNHYLDAILDKDVKSLFTAWEEAEGNGYKAPHKRLSALSGKYFKLKSKLSSASVVEDKYDVTHEVNVNLVEALGYPYQSGAYELTSDNQVIPVLSSLKKDGNPYLWIIDTYWDLSDDARVFDQKLQESQKPVNAEAYELSHDPLENIPALIFKKAEPPRWIILLSGGTAILMERHKWGQGQYLEFDLDEIMARKNIDNFKALAVLLSKEALLPEDANAIHDTLDENSHKHAYSVSSDLKYGLRRAVELLANEYVWYQKNHKEGKGLNQPGLDKQLTKETLTYMYRMLFLFYAEARSGDLGILPMNSDEYRSGYSIESLRDLEQVKLNTEKARNGYYLHESLEKLFRLINDGHTPQQLELGATTTVEYGATQAGMFGTGKVAQGRLKMSPVKPTEKSSKDIYTNYEFSIEALGSPLFDPAKTPLLAKAKYRNAVLQEIIQLLSLSKEGRGRNKGRGRISYAQLGINQLGAVYEGLLSYTGFFAKETLYEVKKAEDKSEDENRQAYFIPESEIDKYHQDEFVVLSDPGNPQAAAKRVKYEKGTFIYRLAGRDREKSASYYTPEVLTKAVVKYSLKELLKDKTADEILKLTVCEPAMGSGAFLNEAVNQLADAYLQEKQKELGKSILPGEYQEELQKVKAYIATHNCYGVDLNPTAVDLAKVSLWLNVIYKHSKTPWFNLRLSSGNSLIGARLQVFKASDLKAKRGKGIENYLDKVPEKVDLKSGRNPDGIYHFFVPDVGMAGFDNDKVIKELLPAEVAKIKEWRKAFTKEFSDAQVRTLRRLSARVDELLKSHLELRTRLLKETTDNIPVWPSGGNTAGININAKERLERELYESSSAYRKLKLVMDYWCVLWFWPIEKVFELPTRDQFIRDCELILEGQTSGKGAVSDQFGFAFRPTSEREKTEAENIHGYGVEKIISESRRLKIVSDIVDTIPFMHWEIQYIEIFKKNKGFDLIVGNPPWIKLNWSGEKYISDAFPYLSMHKTRSLSTSELISYVGKLTNPSQYTKGFVEYAGIISFLSSQSFFPTTSKSQTNLFKSFFEIAWLILSARGIFGFVHDTGIFEDVRGGDMRSEVIYRLSHYFHFYNQLNLFPEESLGHAGTFCVSIGTSIIKEIIGFNTIWNLYHPITIEDCFAHNGEGLIPDQRTKNNGWELRGHKGRIVWYGQAEIKTMHSLLGNSRDHYSMTRVLQLHSVTLLNVIRKIATQKMKLRDISQSYYSTDMFEETSSKRTKKIERIADFVKDPEDFILSGPHYYIGNPLNKTPRENCQSKGDYDRIDLSSIDSGYLPRVVYKLTKEGKKYIPTYDGKPLTEYYRYVNRKMAQPSNERTLISAIIPKNISHIHSTVSLSFKDEEQMIYFAGLTHSIVYDFVVRCIGKPNIKDDVLKMLPLPRSYFSQIITRTLQLNCVTSAYKELWDKHLSHILSEDGFSFNTPLLPKIHSIKNEWNNTCFANNEYARYLLLVELDALAALALNLSLDELISIYLAQFPVLRNNESTKLFDQTGKIVPNEVKSMLLSEGINMFDALKVSNFKNTQLRFSEISLPDNTKLKGLRYQDEKLYPRKERVYALPFLKINREEQLMIAFNYFRNMKPSEI